MTFNKQRLIEVMKQNDICDALEFEECKTSSDCVDLCSRIKHKNGDFIRLRRLSFRHEERVLAEYARKTSMTAKMVECAIAASGSYDVIRSDIECVSIRLENGAVFNFEYNDGLDYYVSEIGYEADKTYISIHTDLEDDLLEATYLAAEMIDNLERMIKCLTSNSSKVTDFVNERLKELNHKSSNDSSYIGSVVKELADKYNKGSNHDS